MALEESDFAKIGDFIKGEFSSLKEDFDKTVEAAKADVKAAAPATPGTQQPASPEGLEYWVHLADGTVVKKLESEISSHIGGIAVVAKYLVGA